MTALFISYRRGDSDIWADRLGEELRAKFLGQVFMDIRDIGPGLPWRQVLDTALSQCSALLVVIGPNWSKASDDAGLRRLDDPTDVLRKEIAEALRRGVRVFPLLVNSAVMPPLSELPDEISTLSDLQSCELTVKHWKADVDSLIHMLTKVAASEKGQQFLESNSSVALPEKRAAHLPSSRLGGALVVIAVVGAALVSVLWYGGRPAPVDELVAQPAVSKGASMPIVAPASAPSTGAEQATTSAALPAGSAPPTVSATKAVGVRRKKTDVITAPNAQIYLQVTTKSRLEFARATREFSEKMKHTKYEDSGRTIYVFQVGPFDTRERAELLQTRLLEMNIDATFVGQDSKLERDSVLDLFKR